MSSVTDEALQDMTTGIASCPAEMEMDVTGDHQLTWFVHKAASDCGLTTALSPLTPPVLCQADTYDSLASDAICQLWLDAGHSCNTKWEDVCAADNPNGADQNPYTVASTSCTQCPVDLCSVTTYFDGIAENLVCDLWLDAGHSCDTKWEDVCANDHPGGADQNDGTLTAVDCSQCLEAMVFEISVTAVGTVETFDKAGFETSMRSYLDCNAPLCQVAIAVTAGSVNVVATVTDSTSTAVTAAAKLTTDSTAVLSAALGVTVEAAPTVSTATKTTLTLRSPPPPPPPLPPPPPQQPGSNPQEESAAVGGNELSSGAIAGILVGCLVGAALLIGAAVLLKKKLQQSRPEEDAVTVTVHSAAKTDHV